MYVLCSCMSHDYADCTSQGMLHASGERVLFVDADGASHFPDLALLQKEMDTLESAQLKAGVEHEAVQGLVVGSRAHLVGTAVVVKVRLLSPDWSLI